MPLVAIQGTEFAIVLASRHHMVDNEENLVGQRGPRGESALARGAVHAFLLLRCQFPRSKMIGIA